MAERRVTSDGDEILSYYEGYDEENRLARGSGLLEFVRMQELIGRFLPSPPRVVLDVGGGPGRYSCWLGKAMKSTTSTPSKSTWSRRERLPHRSPTSPSQAWLRVTLAHSITATAVRTLYY